MAVTLTIVFLCFIQSVRYLNTFNVSSIFLYSGCCANGRGSYTYPKNNMPRMVKFGDAQYFIIAEQDVLTEVHSMTDAIYLWFITHCLPN